MKFISSLSRMLLSLCLLLLTSCSSPTEQEKLTIVSTTTMLHDLATTIGGEQVHAVGLVGVGIDPHLYVPSAKDTTALEEADVILYNGLHLEGEMTELFAHMAEQNKCILSAEDAIDPEELLSGEDSSYDPHIWFDISLWQQTAQYLADQLSQIDPDNATIYEENLRGYQAELQQLEVDMQEKLEEIPVEQRILITAHDAFHYFARCYDFQVLALQGIATTTEATTAHVSDLADIIVSQEIKSIFVESSVSSKNMEALQEAVQAQGFQVGIGGELYSDSLGEGEHGSYITTYKANVHTIVAGLS